MVSVSALPRQSELTVSRKLWRKLCSFSPLKLSISQFKSLIPMRLCTSKTEFSSVFK